MQKRSHLAAILHSETTRRILLVCGSILFALALFELLGALHIVNLEGAFVAAQGDPFGPTNLVDRELLHLHPPHSHFSGSILGGNITAIFSIPRSDMTAYHWDLHYDRNGFRNDRDLTSADIAVIGDSFVENMTTPTAQLASTRLGQLEGKVTVNLGQYGYGPTEELAVLRRYALPLQPRVVVWMFFEGNDLKDVLEHKGDSRTRDPLPGPHKAGHQASVGTHILGRIRRQLELFRRTSGRKRLGIMTVNGSQRDMYFVYGDVSAVDPRALNETADVFATAKKLCAARQTRFLVAFVPTKFRVFRDYCQFPPESDCRTWTLNDLPDRLRQVVGPAGSAVGYLDLTPILADAVKRGVLPYPPDDDHWSPEGDMIVGEALHHYLASTQQ